MARRRQKHVLLVVASLLFVSSAVRLATGVGPALAIAETADQSVVQAAPAEVAPELDPLLAALKAREDQLSEREIALEDRLRALAAAEAEIEKRLEELRGAEESLLAALALSETANETDIARLTAVYENMKPADAAGLFEQMEPGFAAGFVVRMRPETAAAVMAGLDPQTAYSISAIIAGRNANAPTE